MKETEMYFKALIVVSLLFPLIAVFSFIRYRKQRRPGRELLSVRADRALSQITISKPFSVTRNRKWCRVRAVFIYRKTGAQQAAGRHPYTLTIADDKGRTVFTEQRAMIDFLGFCWHPAAKKKVRDQARPVCDTILLEFIPPWPGTYSLFFSLRAAEQTSEIDNLTLDVREDIWPLKKKPYVHTCVNLTKTKTPTGGAA
jgi:hypothetical protein